MRNYHSLHIHYRKKRQKSKVYIKKKKKGVTKKPMLCSYLHKMSEHQLLEVWENSYMQISFSANNEVWDTWRNESFPLKTFSISHLEFLEDIIWLIRLYFILYFSFCAIWKRPLDITYLSHPEQHSMMFPHLNLLQRKCRFQYQTANIKNI